MLEERKSLEGFYVERRENVYVLFVEIVRNKNREQVMTEVIDAYEGEVGRRYTENLLFRFANQELKRTEFSDVAWEKEEMMLPTGKTTTYIKKVGEGTYAMAYVRWYEYFAPGDVLFVPIGNVL